MKKLISGMTSVAFGSLLVLGFASVASAAEQTEKTYVDNEGTEYSEVSIEFPVEEPSTGEVTLFKFTDHAKGVLSTKKLAGFKPSGYATSETKKSTVYSIRAKVTVNSDGKSSKDSGFTTLNNTSKATSSTIKADANKATFISKHGVKTSKTGSWQTAEAEKRY